LPAIELYDPNERIDDPENTDALINDFEETLKNSQDFDLILMDLKFHDQEIGGALIKRINDLNIYTEVIFYSSASEEKLYEQLVANKLQGVYIVERDDDEFGVKVENLITSTLRKVLDLNAMRGIVMAQTSELDKEMYYCVKEYHSKKPDHDEKVTKEVQKRIEKSIEYRAKLLETLLDSGKNLVQALEEKPYLFEAASRFMVLKEKILSNIEKCGKEGHKLSSAYSKFGGYKEQIIDKRNDLAHVLDSELSEEDARSLRKEIIAQSAALMEIREFIDNL